MYWKEADCGVMDKYKELHWHFSEGTKQNEENLQNSRGVDQFWNQVHLKFKSENYRYSQQGQ
jgi:hypothetical protein